MKLKNIFAVALAVLTLTSCDNDTAEDYDSFLGSVNTAQGVSVSLPSTFSFDESESVALLPVTVSGKTNGKVVVTVKVKEVTQAPTETEPAIYGEHYNLTSKTINIASGDETGYIEITPVWAMGEVNKDRVFDVEIVSVKGATVGNKDCQVTIVNIDDPYTALLGTWTLKCSSVFEGGADGPFTVTMKTPDPVSEAEYYGSELYAFGLMGRSYIYLPFSYEYDEATEQANLSIMMGEFATTSIINFGFDGIVVTSSNYPVTGFDFGNDIPLTYGIDEANGVEYYEAPATSEVILAVLPYPALNTVAGAWDGWYKIRLERKLK